MDSFGRGAPNPLFRTVLLALCAFLGLLSIVCFGMALGLDFTINRAIALQMGFKGVVEADAAFEFFALATVAALAAAVLTNHKLGLTVLPFVVAVIGFALLIIHALTAKGLSDVIYLATARPGDEKARDIQLGINKRARHFTTKDVDLIRDAHRETLRLVRDGKDPLKRLKTRKGEAIAMAVLGTLGHGAAAAIGFMYGRSVT